MARTTVRCYKSQVGFEIRQQALPSPCKALELIVEDCDALGEYAVWLADLAGFADGSRAHGPEESALGDEVQSLLELPSAMELNADLDRRFDKLAFLLSPERRRGVSDPDEMSCALNQAVYGVQRLHPGASSTQGFPVRLSNTEDVARINDQLHTLRWDDLKQHLDLGAMSELGVYKAFEDDDPAWIERWVSKDFLALKHLYAEAVRLRWQVLVVQD